MKRAVDTQALITEQINQRIKPIAEDFDLKYSMGYIIKNLNEGRLEGTFYKKTGAFNLIPDTIQEMAVSIGTPITRISPTAPGYYDEMGNIDVEFIFATNLIHKAHNLIYYLRNSLAELNSTNINIEDPEDANTLDKWHITFTPSPVAVDPQRITIDRLEYITYRITINLYLTKNMICNNEKTHWITSFNNYNENENRIIDEDLVYQLPTLAVGDVFMQGSTPVIKLNRGRTGSKLDQSQIGKSFSTYIPNRRELNPILYDLYHSKYTAEQILEPYVIITKDPYAPTGINIGTETDPEIIQQGWVNSVQYITGITPDETKGQPVIVDWSLTTR